MLGCKMRKPLKKTCAGIFRIFCDGNGLNFNQKSLIHSNHTSSSLNFCLRERGYIYSLEHLKNSTQSPSIYRRICLYKSHVRWYSAGRATGFPQLTSLPQELWPGIIAPFSNLFLTYLVIKPYVDNSFDLREFVLASKQVVQIVSGKLAGNDLDGLAEMMTTDALQEIKRNLPNFSVSQRQELAINHEDIYFTSPSAMIFTNDRERDKKYLQINTIHHVMRDLKEFNRLNENMNPFNMQNMQQQFTPPKLDEDKAYILNYKFTREYTSDEASDWLLCGLNHYKKCQFTSALF